MTFLDREIGKREVGYWGAMERKAGLRERDICRFSRHIIKGVRWIAQRAKFTTADCSRNSKGVAAQQVDVA